VRNGRVVYRAALVPVGMLLAGALGAGAGAAITLITARRCGLPSNLRRH
jgi:hypothetical protein